VEILKEKPRSISQQDEKRNSPRLIGTKKKKKRASGNQSYREFSGGVDQGWFLGKAIGFSPVDENIFRASRGSRRKKQKNEPTGNGQKAEKKPSIARGNPARDKRKQWDAAAQSYRGATEKREGKGKSQ